MKRPTNKQINTAAKKLRFFEWSDIEITELVRRVTDKKPTRKYVDGMKAALELAGIEHHPRIKGIVDQIEKDCDEPALRLVGLN
jgi:hypothetical protein